MSRQHIVDCGAAGRYVLSSMEHARVAVRHRMGWDRCYLSESYAAGRDGNDTAWSCYPSLAEMRADETGAHAPRITLEVR